MPATNYGTGRRKTSTARVHLKPGSGKITRSTCFSDVRRAA
jgi:ribosomal protein S9